MLNRSARTQGPASAARTSGHGTTADRASVRGGAGLAGTAEATGSDGRGVLAEAVDGSVLHEHRDTTQALAIVAHDQVRGEVLHEE